LPTVVLAAGEYYGVKGNPFDSGVAVENASLYFIEKSKLTAFNSAVAATKVLAVEAHERFREFVMRPGFSCIGAKAALYDGAYGFAVYDEMGTNNSTAGLCRDLCHFIQSGITLRGEYSTFVAIFHSPIGLTETEFEARLWLQLQKLHRASAKHFEWDQKVSSDPADPRFSFSFAGQAFYVIGLHANMGRDGVASIYLTFRLLVCVLFLWRQA
jgi:FPC/CPF motif-containing protein YcgG